MKSKKLDQFYTKQEVAEFCSFIANKNKVFNIDKVIEPSAGTGAFVDASYEYHNNIESYDIDPKLDKTIEADWLTLPKIEGSFSVIGNPPFGKRSALAIDFLVHAFEIGAKHVAFIVPLAFRKAEVQFKIKKRLPNVKMIANTNIQDNAFVFNGKDYHVGCCFQVWSLNDASDKPDLSIQKKPPLKHEDFELFQYNNTKGALKFLNKEEYGWEFAIPRQGYQDYSKLIYNEDELLTTKQWVLVKPKNKVVSRILKSINYEELSTEFATSTPGFGKADIIRAYEKIVGDIKC